MRASRRRENPRPWGQFELAPPEAAVPPDREGGVLRAQVCRPTRPRPGLASRRPRTVGGDFVLPESLSFQELRSQKQKIVSERERLQAELDHLRKCLALPAVHWSRGYYKGYPR